MLTYGVQKSKDIFGTSVTPVTLTTSYTDNAVEFNTPELSELTLYVKYTPGAGGGGNKILIKVEHSSELVEVDDFYEDVTASAAGNEMVLDTVVYSRVGTVAGTAYKFRFLHPLADKSVKISISENVVGGVAGTATVKALLSGASYK